MQSPEEGGGHLSSCNKKETRVSVQELISSSNESLDFHWASERQLQQPSEQHENSELRFQSCHSAEKSAFVHQLTVPQCTAKQLSQQIRLYWVARQQQITWMNHNSSEESEVAWFEFESVRIQAECHPPAVVEAADSKPSEMAQSLVPSDVEREAVKVATAEQVKPGSWKAVSHQVFTKDPPSSAANQQLESSPKEAGMPEAESLSGKTSRTNDTKSSSSSESPQATNSKARPQTDTAHARGSPAGLKRFGKNSPLKRPTEATTQERLLPVTQLRTSPTSEPASGEKSIRSPQPSSLALSTEGSAPVENVYDNAHSDEESAHTKPLNSPDADGTKGGSSTGTGPAPQQSGTQPTSATTVYAREIQFKVKELQTSESLVANKRVLVIKQVEQSKQVQEASADSESCAIQQPINTTSEAAVHSPVMASVTSIDSPKERNPMRQGRHPDEDIKRKPLKQPKEQPSSKAAVVQQPANKPVEKHVATKTPSQPVTVVSKQLPLTPITTPRGSRRSSASNMPDTETTPTPKTKRRTKARNGKAAKEPKESRAASTQTSVAASQPTRSSVKQPGKASAVTDQKVAVRIVSDSTLDDSRVDTTFEPLTLTPQATPRSSLLSDLMRPFRESQNARARTAVWREYGIQLDTVKSHQKFIVLISADVTTMFTYYGPTVDKIAKVTGCRLRLKRAILSRMTTGSGTWARFAQVEVEGRRQRSVMVCDRLLRENFDCYADRRLLLKPDARESKSATVTVDSMDNMRLAFASQRASLPHGRSRVTWSRRPVAREQDLVTAFSKLDDGIIKGNPEQSSSADCVALESTDEAS